MMILLEKILYKTHKSIQKLLLNAYLKILPGIVYLEVILIFSYIFSQI